MNNESKAIPSEEENSNGVPPKRTVYDGIRISQRSVDLIIAILSVTLVSFLIFALAK